MSGTDAINGFDCCSPGGRRLAYRNFFWRDHAFLRALYCNAHRLDAAMSRSGQPWPFQLRRWRDQGLRTVVNLRGPGAGSAYALERNACNALGLKLIDFRLSAREAPTSQLVDAAQRLFNDIEYPALMHCKSGADRTGFMSALYVLWRGACVETALGQLSWQYLHVPLGPKRALRAFLERYRNDGASSREPLAHWARRQEAGGDNLAPMST